MKKPLKMSARVRTTSILNSLQLTLLDEYESVVQDSPLSPETELEKHVDILLLKELSISAIFWDWTVLESCRTENAFLTE